jgi:hypothetical protein
MGTKFEKENSKIKWVVMKSNIKFN